MDQFRNIGVIGRMGSVKVVESLRQLKQYLITNNYHVILEEDTASMLPGHGLQVASKNCWGRSVTWSSWSAVMAVCWGRPVS